jgi:hypothetical protein
MIRRRTVLFVGLVLLVPALARAQTPVTMGPYSPPDNLPPASAKLSQPPAEPPKDAAGPAEAAKEPDKLTALGQQLDALSKNLTITTADPNIKVVFGGAIVADFLFNSARPVAPGTPFFLAPRFTPGFNQATFDASGRQTLLSAYIVGPEFCGFQSSALIVTSFYSSSLVEDLWGLLPFQAYAQLKNDYWRFAAGLQLDIFNPLNPNILPISYLGASGNTGAFRTQARIERYLHLDDNSQITLTGGISDPIPTTVSNTFRITEDNGWPNVECRVAWGLGPITGEGPDAKRPFEIGVSGVIGQIRNTVPRAVQVIADVWGLGVDARWAINDSFGFQGEAYTGQALGTYMGGILQSVNSATFQALRSSGGWLELYAYICPQTLHTHWGYGIDDPLDRDLAPGQPVRNVTWFANLIWDPSKYFRAGLEVTYRKTAYLAVPNNDGVGVHTQFQFRF